MCVLGGDKDVSTKQDSSKTKSDLSVSIFEQLTLPLRDGRTATSNQTTVGTSGVSDAVASSDPSVEINVKLPYTATFV